MKSKTFRGHAKVRKSGAPPKSRVPATKPKAGRDVWTEASLRQPKQTPSAKPQTRGQRLTAGARLISVPVLDWALRDRLIIDGDVAPGTWHGATVVELLDTRLSRKIKVRYDEDGSTEIMVAGNKYIVGRCMKNMPKLKRTGDRDKVRRWVQEPWNLEACLEESK